MKYFHLLVLCVLCMMKSASAQNDITLLSSDDATEVLASSDNILERIAANQLDRQRVEFLMAPIKSKADLNQFLEENDINKTPFASLAPEIRQRFFSSLVFTKNGLASLYIGDIKGKLSPWESHRMLSLFGASHLASAIYDDEAILSEKDELIKRIAKNDGDSDWFASGYLCESPGTCEAREDHLCTRNC